MTSKTILKLNILFSPSDLPINQIISITQSFAGIPNKARLNYLAVDLNDNVLIRMNTYGYCKFTVHGYCRMYFLNDQNILFAGGNWPPVNIFSLSLFHDLNLKKKNWSDGISICLNAAAFWLYQIRSDSSKTELTFFYNFVLYYYIHQLVYCHSVLRLELIFRNDVYNVTTLERESYLLLICFCILNWEIS